MFPLETYQLTHPELLSKADLSEVLKNVSLGYVISFVQKMQN